jgi:hypothetical protein
VIQVPVCGRAARHRLGAVSFGPLGGGRVDIEFYLPAYWHEVSRHAVHMDREIPVEARSPEERRARFDEPLDMSFGKPHRDVLRSMERIALFHTLGVRVMHLTCIRRSFPGDDCLERDVAVRLTARLRGLGGESGIRALIRIGQGMPGPAH